MDDDEENWIRSSNWVFLQVYNMHTKYAKYTQRKHSHFKQQDGIKVIISILLTQVFRLMNFHVENFSRRIPNIQT